MNLLLIVLIIVLLFYVCQCAKEQFDNSLYLGYGGEPQFKDMTEDYGGIGTINPDAEAKEAVKRIQERQRKKEEELKHGSWRNCRNKKSLGWCLNNWKA
jgi:hypothetical protein